MFLASFAKILWIPSVSKVLLQVELIFYKLTTVIKISDLGPLMTNLH